MHKYQLLRLRADEFRSALEKFSKEDRDVEWFLERWMPWYKKIMEKELRLPCYDYNLGVYFFSGEVTPNLLVRYVAEYKKDLGWRDLKHPLGKAANNFSTAIRDDLSDVAYIARLKKSGELPDLFPDELPPPDEEHPLAKSTEKSPRQGWLKTFLFSLR
ncbi:MAG: hypothetical protein V4614_15785 [Pseudomonadota bacterium]